MTNTNTPPVEYISPQNVSDGLSARDIDVPNNVNKTPNPVAIAQYDINKNTETVQEELREKPTLLNSIPIELVIPIVEYTALSNIVFIDSHGQEYGEDEDYDNRCHDKLYKSGLRLAEAINHQLSLKDTEHAKAIELAKTKTINDICAIACDNQRDAWINGEAFMMAVSKYKQKEEIENARN